MVDTLPPLLAKVGRRRLGVLENTTYIGGEVVIGKEAEGDVKVQTFDRDAL